MDSQQDVIVKYQSAVQKLEQGQYQSAATDLEALVERYPGQFEFVLKLAECGYNYSVNYMVMSVF